jgi:hypothetical protein
MYDVTSITIFFHRQAEKSQGLFRIKLQKLTFRRNPYIFRDYFLDLKSSMRKEALLST